MDNVSGRIAMIVSKTCGGNRSDFARKLGISPGYAAQLYSGERIPSDRTISDICREFGVDRAWLETGVGEPFLPPSRTEELKAVFADVLSGNATEKNAFIEAIAQLPDDVFKVLVPTWIQVAEQMREKMGNK